MLTVLMATFNGEGTLPVVLEAYKCVKVPDGGWKLVVVNNNSNDGTDEILESYRSILPIEILNCPRRGKNVALNLGIQNIEGDLVIFTDDDAIPNSDWLVEYREAADKNKSYDVFGGPIYPVWPSDMDDWILSWVNLGATFAVTPTNILTGSVVSSQIWGANMAIRSHVFEKGFMFNELVGPSEGQYIMGSEVEFTDRLAKAGYKSWWVGEANVGHIIRAFQVKRDWIIKRAFRLGRHVFNQENDLFNNDIKRLFGVPRWKYRQIFDSYVFLLWSYIIRDSRGVFSAQWDISYLRGYLHEGFIYWKRDCTGFN